MCNLRRQSHNANLFAVAEESQTLGRRPLVGPRRYFADSSETQTDSRNLGLGDTLEVNSSETQTDRQNIHTREGRNGRAT